MFYCRRYVFSPSFAVFRTDVTSFYRQFQCFYCRRYVFSPLFAVFYCRRYVFSPLFAVFYCRRYVFSPSFSVFIAVVTSFHRYLRCLLQTLRLFTVICSVLCRRYVFSPLFAVFYCRRYVFSPLFAVFIADVTSFCRHFQCLLQSLRLSPSFPVFWTGVTSFHLYLMCFIADVLSAQPWLRLDNSITLNAIFSAKRYVYFTNFLQRSGSDVTSILPSFCNIQVQMVHYELRASNYTLLFSVSFYRKI